jgi:hypothetical protein
MTAKNAEVPRRLSTDSADYADVDVAKTARNRTPPLATADWDWNLAAQPRLCFAKYLSLYVSTYPHTYNALRIRLYLLLNLNLDLSFNLPPYPALDRALFAKSFRKTIETPNPSSFRSLQVSRNQSSKVLACPQPRRQMPPPRRPLGRPLHGRIVALMPGHTIPCGHRTSS